MKILVTIKKSVGNEMVGETSTFAKLYDENKPIGIIFGEMEKEGNWDIVIPLRQELD